MSDFRTWVEKNKVWWTRIYDEIIAPDFEKEWKKREEEHQHELKKRDENQQLLLNHINEQIVRNAQVVENNERLEVELQQRIKSAAPSTSLQDAATASTGVGEEQHVELTEKYDDLSKKYQDLSQKVKYLERKNKAVMQKNKDMKDSVRAWQQYADRQRQNQKVKGMIRVEEGSSKGLADSRSNDVLPRMLSSPGSIGSISTAYQHADVGHASPSPVDMLTEIEACDGAAYSKESVQSPSQAATSKEPSAASSKEYDGAALDGLSLSAALDRARRYHAETNEVPNSSQTTVDEAPDQLNRRMKFAYVEDEEDLPQVVSERFLKRKRSQQSKVEIYTGRPSDGTPAKPHRIKDEPLSSPPPTMHVLLRTETIDLDDPVANDLETIRPSPRHTSMHSNATGTIRHQRSGSAPFSQTTNQETVQQGHRAINRALDVQTELQIASADMRALSEPMDPPSDEHALQPLDPNIVARAPELTPNKRLKQAATRRTAQEIYAESGGLPPPMDENELILPPSAARACIPSFRAAKDPQTLANRLQYHPTSGSPLVKQEHMPSPPTRTSRPAQSPSGLNGSRRSVSSTSSNQQEDVLPDGRPIWSMRALDKHSVKLNRTTSPSGCRLRLREKPVKELKIHDFKPNPAYNQGHSYAFSEAVRKRGDRLCLPGCTNPQCCGSHFRRLAEALDPLPARQEEALLEEYLGDAYNTVVSTQMSSDERAELVLQARTKKMAKDNGKHREAYERRRTPPGFWRVDFPTTQEQEDDRGRAKEQEVKTVQERWLEAQKKSGRWIFRDE